MERERHRKGIGNDARKMRIRIWKRGKENERAKGTDKRKIRKDAGKMMER